MTEIPEHLRKRAEAARQKAAAAAEPPAEPSAEAAAPTSEAASKIPAHLLERARKARANAGGDAEESGGGGTATLTAAPAGGSAVATTSGPPMAAGPGGHTQRLLTVVKSGSIQDVKATPQDKVHTWPHLLAVEFVACVACLVFLLIFSIFVNAPLQALANTNLTPNPSKAPWYFLGLQELLTMLNPMVAGVTVPGMGIFVLILAPYIDRNPSNKPEARKFSTSLFTVFIMFWAVLVIIGSFFRGPGFNFVFPWHNGLFFDL